MGKTRSLTPPNPPHLLPRHVTDGHVFKDNFLYYRFFADENESFKKDKSRAIKPLSILDPPERTLMETTCREIKRDSATISSITSLYNISPTSVAASNAGRGESMLSDLKSASDSLYGPCMSRFKFANHTAHNSLVLNLQLAEMIEKLGSAGADDNMRKVTVLRLREKVRDEFLVGVDWKLVARRVRV